MREHKFKAWNVKDKRWQPWLTTWKDDECDADNDYDFKMLQLLIDENGHVLENTFEHGIVDTNSYTAQGPKYILVEYIGRKDKNGKEVYEGDITRDRILNYKTKTPEDNERIFQVYWDEETASFWQKLISCPDKKYRLGMNFAAELNCEVIGNVFENPELLED